MTQPFCLEQGEIFRKNELTLILCQYFSDFNGHVFFGEGF